MLRGNVVILYSYNNVPLMFSIEYYMYVYTYKYAIYVYIYI